MTYVCAPDDQSAVEKAEAVGVTDGEVRRVGPDPADLDGASGRLLFADSWRDVFPSWDEDPTGETASRFVMAAHRQPGLTVEVVQ